MIPKTFVIYLPFVVALTISIPVSAQGLIISNGANLIVHDTANIVVNDGGITNSGVFNGGTGVVTFTGALPATLSGSSITYFNTITLNKPANTLTLFQHSGVNDRVNLIAGNIDLNGYNLDLGNTGYLNGETDAARVLGPNGGLLIRSADISVGTTVNPGNLGMVFTPTTNLGLTVITRGHQSLLINGNNSINRFYEVATTNSADVKENITFQYLDDELNENIESDLGVYYIKTTDTTGFWQTKNAADVNANTIQITNGAFSGKYIIASNKVDSIYATPLVANMNGNTATLSWTTLFERNTVRFELQRSVQNGSFHDITTIPAAGNSDIAHNYTFLDAEPVSDLWNYRYKIIFNDSTYLYSNIVTVSPAGYQDILLQVTPNPTTGPVNIKFNSIDERKVYLEIISNTGALVARREINATRGMNTASIDISNAGAGTYYIILEGITDKAYKIIKLNP